MEIRRRAPPANQTDWMTKYHAGLLADAVRRHWLKEFGLQVETRLMRSGNNYYVRSDMINGKPKEAANGKAPA